MSHTSLADAQWSLTITLLVGAVVTPVLGRLGDGPHRRIVIMASIGTVALDCALPAPRGVGFPACSWDPRGVGVGLVCVSVPWPWCSRYPMSDEPAIPPEA